MSHTPDYPLSRWTLLGFTGHREIHEPEAVTRAIGTVIDRLATSHGPIAGVSSLASGADTLFVEELALRRIPYFLILPFPMDRFKQDFTDADWERIQPLLNQAIHIMHASPAQTPEEAYLDTGILTVNDADVLLAVWNGNPGKAGGTADVIAYARAAGNPLIIINPQSRQVAEERLEQLAPPTVNKKIEASTPPGPPRLAVEACFKQLDQDANTHGPTARQQVLRMILLHLAAAGVALFPLTFHREGIENTIAIALEVVFLIAALIIAFRHRHTHHAWLRTRIDAELCRSFLSLWHFRRQGAALPGKGNIQDSLSHDLYRSLRITWFLDPTAALPMEAARDHYLQNRLNHQLRYFTEKGRDAQRFGRILKAAASVGTILAIIAGQVALTLHVAHQHDANYSSAKLLSLLLPLFSAGILTFAAANDWSRRAERFQQMARHLQQAASELLTARTWPGLWRTISRTEEFLLLEVIEWHAVSRYTGESH